MFKEVFRDNKRSIIAFCIAVAFIVITFSICFATDIIVPPQSSAEVVLPVTEQPMISNNNTLIFDNSNRSIHDLTDVEWEGLKGIRGKDALLDYLKDHPQATLTEAINNVKGFGVKSAEIIENYLTKK